MSKTRITISARKRPKSAAKPAPKVDDKPPGGGPNLPGDRYTDAQCRVTVADFSTLYLFHADETDGHAIIGSSNNKERDHDTGGVSMKLDYDSASIIAANVDSLDLWEA